MSNETTTEVKTCPHCGKKLRAHNQRGACSACLKKPGMRPSQRKGSDDGVLSRMGFHVDKSDEAPPATERKRAKSKSAAKVAPSPLVVARPDLPKWQGQFTVLAGALGLDPEAMLEQHCRTWVEATRARALPPATPQLQLPAGNGAESPVPPQAEG